MRYSNITQVRMGRAIAVEGMLVHTLTRGHGYHLEDRAYLRPANPEREEDDEDPPVE
jgi:hypothetical protein